MRWLAGAKREADRQSKDHRRVAAEPGRLDHFHACAVHSLAQLARNHSIAMILTY
jgi:hypothetical protein